MQLAAFEAALSRDPVLVSAPTGSGKTAAVLLPLLARLAARPRERRGRVLVVAPVRALVESLRASIEGLVASLSVSLRVGSRTGDSTARARRSVATSPPDVLITTPESLAVMLATDARAVLLAVTELVLDELQILFSGKRGALFEATLACLDAWVCSHGGSAPRRLAMSATATPLAALAARLGTDARLVVDRGPSASLSLVDASAESPFPNEAWMWRSALPALARRVVASDGATLVFASSRARAERWSLALRDVLPSRMGVGCFHASLSAEERGRVTDALRAGALKVLVATSALEVGVDFPGVTQVILLGAPSSLQRATQAAGRGDHRPGVAAHAMVLPLGTLDLLQSCAARDALATGAADEVELLEGDLDVAAQAVLGAAASGPCERGSIARILRATQSFAALSDEEIARVIEFLTSGGDAFAAYPEMARLASSGAHVFIANRRSMIRYLRGIGTIMSDVTATVICGAQVLGELQGRFASSLDVGDRFALGGRCWRVVGRASGTIFVRADRSRDRVLPAWEGSAASLSPRMTEALESLWTRLDAIDLSRRGEALGAIATQLALSASAAEKLLELLLAQRAFTPLPSQRRFVIEVQADEGALSVVAHTFAGRSVNQVIARALALRARESTGDGADITANDWSACARIPWRGALPGEETLRAWLDPRGLRDALVEAQDGSTLGAASFREVARIAQLWLPDARRGAVTPGLLYDVLRRHDPEHVLLRAQRHTLWFSLEGPRAEATLVERQSRRWCVCAGAALSPLALPVVAAMARDTLRPDDLEASLLDAANALYRRTLDAVHRR